jgi:Tfp pilus assembly protein PilX
MLLALKPDWQRRHNSRRGAILVVVLALFAVIGITFVHYASTEAEIARVFKFHHELAYTRSP